MRIQRGARSWVLHKRYASDRATCCELAGVSEEAFVAFTRNCLQSFDAGGAAAIKQAAKYLYNNSLKNFDTESSFLSSPESIADDSDISDGLPEITS